MVERMTDTMRERLPETRNGFTRHFAIGGVDVYATIGMYDDGRPGELFVRQAGHSGDHLAVVWDALGIAVSLALQYGTPPRALVDHFRGMRSGDVCGTPSADELASATSILDALARWFAQRWPEFATGASVPPPPVNAAVSDAAAPPVPPADGPCGGAGGVLEVQT